MNDKIRNFSIIAHIDHGKSTLAGSFSFKTPNFADNVQTKKAPQKWGKFILGGLY